MQQRTFVSPDGRRSRSTTSPVLQVRLAYDGWREQQEPRQNAEPARQERSNVRRVSSSTSRRRFSAGGGQEQAEQQES